MARILHNAKEDLVYWAVNMNFHETKIEKFTNQLLFSNSLFAASDLIDKVSSLGNNKDSAILNDLLEKTVPIFSIVERLRKNIKSHMPKK